MPTIPNLERRSVTPQTRIATVDPRGAASLGNTVGRGIQQIQNAYQAAKTKDDKYQLADAASKFAILKHQQDNAFDEDDLEYETFVDRYSKNVDEGLNEIAQSIRDPELRNLFLMENRPRVVEGVERIRDKAFRVETDVQRSHINSRLNGLREVILGDDEAERVRAIRDTKVLLESAKEKGYYSAEEMVKVEKAYTVDAAIGYVDTLPLERQREALNSQFVRSNIPSDIIAKKLRGLEEKETLEQAQIVADSLIGKSLVEQDQEMRKYSGKLREQIKSQIEYNNANLKKIKLNTDQTLHQDWYMKVITRDEGFTLQDLQSKDNKEFLKLEVEFQKDLLRAAQAAVTSSLRTQSDANVIDRLHSLNANKKWEELRQYYKANVDKLDSTDMDTWSKISNEGVVPPEYKPLFSMIQTVDQKLAASGIKNVEDSLKVRNQLSEWYKREFDRLQKEPDPEKMERQIDAYIKEVTIPIDYWPDDDERAFNLTPEESLKMSEKVISDPTSVDIDTFKVATRELLNRHYKDPDERFEVIGTALSRSAELQTEEQEELVDYVKTHEPEIYDRVFNIFAKRGKDVNSTEFMQGLSEVFNGTK